MKIAFFGQRQYLDYYRIGGFESYIRRLAQGLAQSAHEVHYILYDASQEKVIVAAPGLKLSYCRTFDQALARLFKGNYHHVFRVRLAREDYLKYLWAVRRNGYGTRWHHCYLAWPESFIKRALVNLEARLASPGGVVICVSPRQYRAISKYTGHTGLIWPPVPEDYFLTPEKKGRNEPINVTFLGNLTRDKYIAEVVTLFEKFHTDPRFHFAIYGTHDRFNPQSVEMHHRLLRQNAITYVHIDMEDYSPDIDTLVKNVLWKTDVFLQPYRTLQNTLDTPLLLLEAMAALCAVITTPRGNVPDIYGKSRFLLTGQDFQKEAEHLLRSLTWEDILAERTRIIHRSQEIQFQQKQVLEKLLAVLKND